MHGAGAADVRQPGGSLAPWRGPRAAAGRPPEKSQPTAALTMLGFACSAARRSNNAVARPFRGLARASSSCCCPSTLASSVWDTSKWAARVPSRCSSATLGCAARAARSSCSAPADKASAAATASSSRRPRSASTALSCTSAFASHRRMRPQMAGAASTREKAEAPSGKSREPRPMARQACPATNSSARPRPPAALARRTTSTRLACRPASTRARRAAAAMSGLPSNHKFNCCSSANCGSPPASGCSSERRSLRIQRCAGAGLLLPLPPSAASVPGTSLQEACTTRLCSDPLAASLQGVRAVGLASGQTGASLQDAFLSSWLLTSDASGDIRRPSSVGICDAVRLAYSSRKGGTMASPALVSKNPRPPCWVAARMCGSKSSAVRMPTALKETSGGMPSVATRPTKS
mmetsp:Transcript_61643/g.170878  ORF Transcript_61643/g.170878 Transcript_61643/m.170878 type:complete len:406 (-) Transcript_61643:655-1872(-)